MSEDNAREVVEQEEVLPAPEEVVEAEVVSDDVAEPVVSEEQLPVVDVPDEPVSVAPKRRFEKLWNVAELIRFEDGSTFKFPVIIQQNGVPQHWSRFETSDEELAGKLAELAKTRAKGVVDVDAVEAAREAQSQEGE